MAALPFLPAYWGGLPVLAISGRRIHSPQYARCSSMHYAKEDNWFLIRSQRGGRQLSASLTTTGNGWTHPAIITPLLGPVRLSRLSQVWYALRADVVWWFICFVQCILEVCCSLWRFLFILLYFRTLLQCMAFLIQSNHFMSFFFRLVYFETLLL